MQALGLHIVAGADFLAPLGADLAVDQYLALLNEDLGLAAGSGVHKPVLTHLTRKRRVRMQASCLIVLMKYTTSAPCCQDFFLFSCQVPVLLLN